MIEELALGLRCDDMALGRLRVVAVDTKLMEVLHLEGENAVAAEPEVGLNSLHLPAELRRDLFHAARCKCEHKRTGNLDYLRGYDYFLKRVAAWGPPPEHRGGSA